MVIISSDKLAAFRREVAGALDTVSHDKKTINKAHQAIEDWVEESKPTLWEAVDRATTPYVFTERLKNRLLAAWKKGR